MIRPLALCVLIATPALAQDGPSFDCAKAESSVEKLICADPGLARLDRTVSERYAEARKAAQGLGAGADEASNTLRALQRGWVKGRDDCWKATDQRACVEDAYLRRDAELVTGWMLDTPRSTAFWACDGNAEVVTMFFDTELPGLRFEVGDTIDTGTLVPTGSGARYEGSFGRSIWISGQEASYTAPDGTTLTCTLRAER